VKVVLFGATGMVGKGVLLEALDAPDVERVTTVGRRATGLAHPKLVEVVHADLGDLAPVADRLRGHDACFDCLGVTSAGMKEADYARVTYDYAVEAAERFLGANPDSVFTYVSGAGTDSTEKGRAMWARVKGRTENTLLEMPFRGAYMFRPGLIKPERGVTSRTGWYRAFYAVGKPLVWAMEKAAPDSLTTTRRVGLAMLHVAATAPPQHVLETRDINRLAAAREAARPRL
jgi:uncharacterized protein YbjT (DUF2867 family)